MLCSWKFEYEDGAGLKQPLRNGKNYVWNDLRNELQDQSVKLRGPRVGVRKKKSD